MEKNLVSMAREVEKLRAELSNFDGRLRGVGMLFFLCVSHRSLIFFFFFNFLSLSHFVIVVVI